MKVCLRDSVYSLWKEKQGHTGFGNHTKNEFARCLLHRNEVEVIFNGRQTLLRDNFEEATRSKFRFIAKQVNGTPSRSSLHLLSLSGCICHSKVITIFRLPVVICVDS